MVLAEAPAVPPGTVVQPGDFACVPVNGQAGALIRLGELLNGHGFSQYQHAEIYVGTAGQLLQFQQRMKLELPMPAPFGYTMSAYPGGARLKSLPCRPGDLHGSLWSSGAISLAASERTAVVEAALSLRGVPYSALDYFALALHHFGISDPALQRKIESSKSLICSQLVDKAFQLAFIQLFTDHRWNGYVTPADLAGLIMSKRVAL